MENQYTPTYSNLWNKGFLSLVIAELLLCVSCYMSIPFLPQILTESNACSLHHTYFAIIAFVVGMYASGSFCSWLIQRFRRNKVFLFSALVFGLLQVCFFSLEESIRLIPKNIFTVMLHGALFVSGAAFGLAKRILSCTLLIDKTESHHRTEANYVAVAIARLAIAIGPVIFFLLRNDIPHLWYHAISIGLILTTAFLVFTQKFPFRAPEDGIKIISTDRFFLPQGWKVFAGICCITLSFGFVMPYINDALFYIFLLFGFLCSIIILRSPMIRNWKYTFITGLATVLLALTMLTFTTLPVPFAFLTSSLAGIGLGTACSCQLFHMLELCNHCQRSTAESTYFLACDGGIFAGLALSYILAFEHHHLTAAIAALCCIAAISCHKRENTDKTI